MTFSSTATDQPREADGKFGEKTGSAPELDGFLLVGDDKSKVADLEVAVHNDTIAITLPNGDVIDFETEDKNVYSYAAAAELRADGTTEVRWACYDDDPGEYNFTEGDSIQEFRSESDRDEFIAQQLADGVPEDHIFVVEKFSHGLSRYSVFDGKLSDRWDAAPSNVLVIDAKNEMGIEPENLRSAADATLEDYTSWANGDTYFLTRAVIGADGEEVADSRETIHGFVGSEYAEESIKAGDF